MEVALHEKCPACGKGIGEQHLLIKKGIENKTLPKGTEPQVDIIAFIYSDAAKPPLVGGRVAATRTSRDVCEFCGCAWSFKTERGHVTYTGNPQMLFKDFK